MAKRKCTRYAVYDDSVKFKDRYKVPNFKKITKYKKKSKASKIAKKHGDKVYKINICR